MDATHMGTARPDRADRVIHRRKGFTLVEVLIVISIIGVLIGILLPALRNARVKAMDVVCLSNLRQAATGWNSYLSDYRMIFPQKPAPGRTVTHHMFDWGGVDWYDDNLSPLFDPQRPVNPYMSNDAEQLKGRAEGFRCPRDFGVYHSGTTARHRYEVADFSNAEDRDETTFGVMGTSFRANDWIWAGVGDPAGFTTQSQNGLVGSNGIKDVTSPSKMVLVGDFGPFIAGRYAREARPGPDLPPQYDFLGPSGVIEGWWHGEEMCNLAFLDGSARLVQMTPGTAATNEYHFWLQPRLHGPDSSVYAQGVPGTGRPENEAGTGP